MASRTQRTVKVKEDRTPFIIFAPWPCYVLPPIGNDIPPEGIVTTSIDIGIKNFAIRIERRHNNGIILPLFLDKVDFTRFGVDTSDNTGTAVIDPRVLTAATQFMLYLMPLISKSRIVGIERQMAVNTKSTKMFQHILTILLIYHPTFENKDCIIFDIWAKLKGQMLGAPKGMNSPQLKEWTINRVLQILEWRGDYESIKIIQSHRGKSKTKADDLADTIAQMEAWFILNNGIVTQQPFVINLPVQRPVQTQTLNQYLDFVPFGQTVTMTISV
jgi:hypothetical protein